MHEGLQKVFDALPLKCNKLFIAGGAAVDFDKATDVDLWVPYGAIQAGIDIFNGINFPKRAVYTQANSKYNKNKDFTLIGDFYFEPIKKIVQIIVADGEASTIISGFDLSVHMQGVTRSGSPINSFYWTHPKIPIEILRSNETTFNRYIKLCARYGHEPQLSWLNLYFPGDIEIEYNPDTEEAEETPAQNLNSLAKAFNKVPAVSTPESIYSWASWSALGSAKSTGIQSSVFVDASAIEKKLADMNQAKAKMMSYILYGEDPKSDSPKE